MSMSALNCAFFPVCGSKLSNTGRNDCTKAAIDCTVRVPAALASAVGTITM